MAAYVGVSFLLPALPILAGGNGALRKKSGGKGAIANTAVCAQAEIDEDPDMESRQRLSNSLYERLGGAERVQAIAHDIVEFHLVNPIIAPRFQNHDVPRLKQLAFEFFCAGGGGPETYTGRDMQAAHAGMNISEQEYVATMDDIVRAMEKHGVGCQERNEVIAVLYSLKGEIIRV